MIITGLATLGRDCELRHTPSGDAVTNLSLAFNYGQKDQQTGNKPTCWLEGSLWGKRAESLAPYLVKGQKLVIVAEDPHIETYEGKNGPGSKLVARIVSIDFAGSPPQQGDGGQQQGRQQPQQNQQRQAPQGNQQQRGGYDDQQGRGQGGQQSRGPQQRQQQGNQGGGYQPNVDNRGGARQDTGSGFDSMDDDIHF